jgi:predicted small metal-binding protein
MKQFRCGDILPGCGWAAQGTEEEIFAQLTVHALNDHGVAQVSDELVGQVRGHIHALA